MPQIQCSFRNQKIKIKIDDNDNVSALRAKIASVLKKDPSKINLYFANKKLSNNTSISELELDTDSIIKVHLVLKPLIKRKIHIYSTEVESKLIFLKKEMKFIISNSDNITTVMAAQNILNSPSDVSISDLFSNSIECPYICSYIFNLFKQEIAKSIDNQTISLLYNQCDDMKLLGHIFNYLSEANETVTANFFSKLPIGKRLLSLLEHTNFSSKFSIVKNILSKVPKYKGDLADAAPYLIIFINNINSKEKNYFSEIFNQTRDLKRSKYKNSPEVRMLLLSISIKCDKVQDTLKRYDNMLTTSVVKPKLTKAVLSTIHQLYLLSLNEETRFIDSQTIQSVFKQIPENYDLKSIICLLVESSIRSNPDIFKNNKDSEIKFADILEFSFSRNFEFVMKSDIVKETYLMYYFSWIINGINFMKIFKLIYDINSANPDFSTPINSLFLIYSSSGPEICPSTFSINADSHLHHHAYYPSQIIDTIFNLLILLVDILPKNDNKCKLDSRYIFEFSFLILLRPSLSLQKAALKIIKKVFKYKNNDNLSELILNENDGRRRRRSSDSNRENDMIIYKNLMDQINDSSYSDFNESSRIIRGALLYFVKSPQSFRDDVFSFADISSGNNLIQKIKYYQEVQRYQIEQLKKTLDQKENIQNQQSHEIEQEKEKEKEKEIPHKKSKSTSKSNKNALTAQKPASAPPGTFPTPVTPKAKSSPYNSDFPDESRSIDDLSYSSVYLKILLDRIETNFDGYVPFLKSRPEFTSIAFSFISFGGNSPNIRESFLNFVSNTNTIKMKEKLELIFRFVQNEKKLEPKASRQSDSHISIKKFHTMGSQLISNSCDQLIIPPRPKKPKAIVNSNIDSSSFEREINIIFTILKSFKNIDLTSDKFNYQKLMYLYVASHLASNKSFSQDFHQLLDPIFDVLSNPKCIIYENIRLYSLSIFYSLYDNRATYLLPQVLVRPVVDFLKHQDNENKKFFNFIFHSFLIDNESSLKKAVCMLLSLKPRSKIDFSLDAFDILKENPRKAIRILFYLLSSKLITNDMITKVIDILKFFFERKYPIESRNVPLLATANEDVLETLFDETSDYIIRFLPLFMLHNVFSLKLWEKIAEDYKVNVLQCVISTFSAYSGNLAYMNSNGEDSDEHEKAISNIKIAYELFDTYGVKKSKPWQIIALSLLFIERNEFALEHLNNLIDDNDRLASIKKLPIADHFENPIKNLLNNCDKSEIDSAILEILPLVKSKQNFNKLFSYIQNEEELDTKKVLKTINVYYSLDRNLTAPSSFLDFLISKIDDEDELKKLSPEIMKLILLRKNKYIDLNESEEEEEDE